MNTWYIERSTGECRNGDWTEKAGFEGRPDRIVVGTGPGSFAGIRAALAFAQGYALGSGCEVLGLPSACAVAGDEEKLAVVGDARRGKIWIALFERFAMKGEVFQVETSELAGAIASDCLVTTPDAARIGELLKSTFGDRYLGGRTPTADGLRRFAEANPSVLVKEPLPIYLNPAVRPD